MLRDPGNVGFVSHIFLREIRRRTRAVGAFPDGNSAILLVCARLRHIVGKTWGSKRYLDMSRLGQTPELDSEAETS